MDEEIWKPVPSRPGVMASSLGRVMLPEREGAMPHGGSRIYKTRPTFGVVTRASKASAHIRMSLYSRQYGNMKVHKLVCEAFNGPQPTAKSVVIHIDEDGTNNKPSNLKWGSMKENLNMPKFIAYCKSRTGENSPSAKSRKKKRSSQ